MVVENTIIIYLVLIPMVAFKKNGFTLVELLVTIGIIATLIAVLAPNLMGARERARDAQKKQDLDSMKSALRMFYNDVQNYPTFGGGLDNDNASESGLGTTLASFMPAVANIGFTYYYYGAGDSFFLWAPMEAIKPDESRMSQLKCGVANNQVISDVFMVCGR